MLLIADEPDQGLHISAGKSVSQVLRDSGRTCLIASHSPGVVRDSKANLLHVERGPTGEVRVERFSRRDESQSAIVLGLDPVDLLPNVKVAVFVEGEHDLEVINSFLRFRAKERDCESRLGFIKVFANRGVNQMVNAIDARLLLDYLDCEIVAIADQVRSNWFSPLVAELKKMQHEGQSISQTAQRLEEWFHEARTRAETARQRIVSSEERTMHDLLKVAIERLAAHRVHVHGIPSRDISELLPSSAFGLDRSWSQLHSDHDVAKKRARESTPQQSVGSFKEWLKAKHRVALTTNSIVQKFRLSYSSVEGPPKDLVRIGDYILDLVDG
jgi:hypothetical protein